ncbi:MAG: serine acetyltransferase [Methylococcales bacterium]|nr:serine acetyltransferase [Methylococcales bacterium]MDD5755318.1 serine acetyltransferase [Methylococcales bacterium]
MNDFKYQNIELDWGIDELITKLHDLRDQSLEADHQRHQKLPSSKELQNIIDGVGAVLFPHRLGPPDLNNQGVDHFVGHELNAILLELYKQVRCELQFVSEHLTDKDAHEQAFTITREFATRLPDVRAMLDSDIKAAYEGDPAARDAYELLVCYPGIKAVIHYRLAHILHQLGLPLVARIISDIAHSATGIDIHPGAQIGERFFVDHGTGVVIGETSVIGKNVRVYQAVTLGAKSFQKDDNGIIVKGQARHPIIEDDVVIYAGATVLGRITIGKGSSIGGNVWLTHGVPPGSNITQAKARNELFSGGTGI